MKKVGDGRSGLGTEDAASFDELSEALAATGKDRADLFVVQVGVDYPDEVFILL